MATWHTVESAREQWPDAPVDEDGGDEQLTELLAVAKDAILAFAPVSTSPSLVVVDDILVPSEDDVPDGYRMGQLLQARNVWNSSRAGAAGDMDGGSYGLTSFPLDWQVRQLVRPKRGRPVVG